MGWSHRARGSMMFFLCCSADLRFAMQLGGGTFFTAVVSFRRNGPRCFGSVILFGAIPQEEDAREHRRRRYRKFWMQRLKQLAWYLITAYSSTSSISELGMLQAIYHT